jgi:di/tricarboxylate transporter
LVYGSGHYQFADFVKVTVMCAQILMLLAPVVWQG